MRGRTHDEPAGDPRLDPKGDRRQRRRLVHERLEELRVMIEMLNVTGRICFDHNMNSWTGRNGGMLFQMDYDGYKFPEEKPHVLELIREGLSVDESRHVNVKDLIAMESL